MNGWIGVDLDGTLAEYTGWKDESHIGDPILPMLERVKEWLEQDIEVRIFTARVSTANRLEEDVATTRILIQDWCELHLGKRLEVTNQKDYAMMELWDDRCVQVIPNTGIPITRPD